MRRITLLSLILIALFFNFCKKEFKRTTVLIQPLGEVSEVYLNISAAAIREQYKCVVYVGKPLPVPKNFKSAKGPNRFRADSIIQWMKDDFSDSLNYIIGLTESDISTRKQEEFENTGDAKYLDWGIFGLGYMPGRACVVSTYRLKTKLKNQNQLNARIRKVVLHEFGHNLGLPHCENQNCVMASAAEKISNLDISSDRLCSSCGLRLKD